MGCCYSSFFVHFFCCSLLVIWWLSFCLDSFLFLVCISVTDFWFVATMKGVSVSVCVRVCLKFESILTTLNFPPLPFTVFHIIFCIFSFCTSLNYLLWIDMILFLLSFNLPSNFTTGWSMTFTICSPLPVRFFFCNFNIPMSVIFSVYTSPFNIVIKQVLCYWSQLAFACL